MAITLADAKLNTQDDIDLNVIDEFRKSSWLLDNLTFHNVVNPAGGGSALTYGYTRLVTERPAAFRAYNTEYVDAEADRQRYTVDLKPLGGSFSVDRVLAHLGPARSDEVAFQMAQLIKSVRTKFQDAVINGDTAVEVNGFDGLDKALTGSSTEIPNTTALNWTAVDSQGEAFAAMEALDELLALLDGRPNAIIGNKRALMKIRQIGRWSGYRTESEDAFGRMIEGFDGIPLIDLGEKAGSNDAIIPVDETTGTTDLYAVRFGLDGFHAVSTTGPLVQTWLPDFTTPRAVKPGEAELGPVAVALKATKSAAVARNVQVQAATP